MATAHGLEGSEDFQSVEPDLENFIKSVLTDSVDAHKDRYPHQPEFALDSNATHSRPVIPEPYDPAAPHLRSFLHSLRGQLLEDKSYLQLKTKNLINPERSLEALTQPSDLTSYRNTQPPQIGSLSYPIPNALPSDFQPHSVAPAENFSVPHTLIAERFSQAAPPSLQIQHELQRLSLLAHLQQVQEHCMRQLFEQRQEHSRLLFHQLAMASGRPPYYTPPVSPTGLPPTFPSFVDQSGYALQQAQKTQKTTKHTKKPSSYGAQDSSSSSSDENESVYIKPESHGQSGPFHEMPSFDGSSTKRKGNYSSTGESMFVSSLYMCPFPGCGEKLLTKSGLTRHQKKHTGEKKFLCPYEGCGKKFPESNTLKRHYRVHTGEKPFKCANPGCMKSFRDASNFRRHQLMHRGEKPYKCPMASCARCFSRGSTLKKHLIGVHKLSPSDPIFSTPAKRRGRSARPTQPSSETSLSPLPVPTTSPTLSPRSTLPSPLSSPSSIATPPSPNTTLAAIPTATPIEATVVATIGTPVEAIVSKIQQQHQQQQQQQQQPIATEVD